MCYWVDRIINWRDIWTWRVTHIRSMDVGGYRHNNKGFCENFTFRKSINRGRTTIIEVPMQA